MLIQNPKHHDHFYIHPSMDPILSQRNQTHTLIRLTLRFILILLVQSSNLEVPPKTANSYFPLLARIKYMNAIFLHKAKLAWKQTYWWIVCIFCFEYMTLPPAGNMDVLLQKDCAIYNSTRKFHVNPANRHYTVGSTRGIILSSPLQPTFLHFKRYSINVAQHSLSQLTWNTLLLWPLS